MTTQIPDARLQPAIDRVRTIETTESRSVLSFITLDDEWRTPRPPHYPRSLLEQIEDRVVVDFSDSETPAAFSAAVAQLTDILRAAR